MRHAKSSWKGDTNSDHARPLNKRGRHDAPRIAERLGELGGARQRVAAIVVRFGVVELGEGVGRVAESAAAIERAAAPVGAGGSGRSLLGIAVSQRAGGPLIGA